jgi:hypothetical protein
MNENYLILPGSNGQPEGDAGWCKISTAMDAGGLSRKTMKRLMQPWSEQGAAGSVRFKILKLAASKGVPRLFVSDLKLLLLGKFATEDAGERLAFTCPLSPLWRIKFCAQYLDLSRDTIERRMVDWDAVAPCRIRSVTSELKVGRNRIRLCSAQDTKALLTIPSHQ